MLKGFTMKVQIPEETIKKLRQTYIRKGYPDPFDSEQVTEMEIKGVGRDGSLMHQTTLECLITDLLELEYNELEFEGQDSLSDAMRIFKEQEEHVNRKTRRT